MKKSIYILFITILFFCLAIELHAEKLEIGAKFPVEKLSPEKKPVDNTIIAFMPSLTYDCDYASMLTQSFYYYFDQRMAFEGLKKSPTTRVFLVVRDKPDAPKSTQNIIGGMNVIYDEKGTLFSDLEIKQPVGSNSDSTIVLLDANNKINLIDENYRAQGEHLKPLENKLKELNGIYQPINLSSLKKELKIGDTAPDFLIDEKTKLSNLRGDVVLISFYPAAFSGTLPKPISLNGIKIDTSSMMSCAIQIDSLDKKLKKVKKEPKRIVISSSTKPLLENWQNVLKTRNVLYANDADYSISLNYDSYNPNGYNSRASVIIDQKGKIAFIDKDFNFNSEKILNAKMDELLK